MGSFGIDVWSHYVYVDYQETQMMDNFYFFNNRTNYPNTGAFDFAMNQKNGKDFKIPNIYSWEEPQPVNAKTLFDHIDLRNSLMEVRTALEGVAAVLLSPAIWIVMWIDTIISMGILPAIFYVLPLYFDTPEFLDVEWYPRMTYEELTSRFKAKTKSDD